MDGPLSIKSYVDVKLMICVSVNISLCLFHQGNKKEEASFTVPKDTTFAYGLMEITTEGGTLGETSLCFCNCVSTHLHKSCLMSPMLNIKEMNFTNSSKLTVYMRIWWTNLWARYMLLFFYVFIRLVFKSRSTSQVNITASWDKSITS